MDLIADMCRLDETFFIVIGSLVGPRVHCTVTQLEKGSELANSRVRPSFLIESVLSLPIAPNGTNEWMDEPGLL